MAGASAGDWIEVVTTGQLNATDADFNVYRFQLLEGSFASDEGLLDDLEELVTAILNTVKALYYTFMAWSNFKARNLTRDTATIYRTLASPILGTDANYSAAWGVCGLVSFPTEVARVILRKYYGPVAKDLLTSTGFLTAGATGILTDLSDLLLDEIETSFGLWQYSHPYGPLLADVRPVGSIITNVPAYQRRRKPGTGI
jgi:hypothetical protein